MEGLKVIQVTDLHFLPPGLRLLGIDPRARLAACIEEINRLHGDAAFCVFTGDLADRGAPEAYRLLRDSLAALALPHRLLIGNHDDRAAFCAAFPEAARDDGGFVQSHLETDQGDLLFLDTHAPGQHAGAYCEARCRWLAERLAAGSGPGGRGQPAYLFLHHPPFEIGIPSLDAIRIAAPEGLARVLRESGRVRHLFFGHLHRSVSGSWRGLPYSCLPSLVHQVPLDLVSPRPVPYNRERPGYGVIWIAADQVTVHVQALGEETALPRDLPRYGSAP